MGAGNASGTVVRIGANVRTPWSKSTISEVPFVEALRSSDIDVPKPLGRDECGRQIQEFVPGALALTIFRRRPRARRLEMLVRGLTTGNVPVCVRSHCG